MLSLVIPQNQSFDVELKMAQKRYDGPELPYPVRNCNPFEASVVFNSHEINLLTAVSSTADSDGSGAGGAASNFATDTQISSRPYRERELERWQPDADDVQFSGSLDDERPTKRGWDQFAINAQKFEVKSTFDMRHYTTELDQNSDFYKANEHRAEKLAQEIMRETSNNVHVALDRDQEVEEVSSFCMFARSCFVLCLSYRILFVCVCAVGRRGGLQLSVTRSQQPASSQQSSSCSWWQSQRAHESLQQQQLHEHTG